MADRGHGLNLHQHRWKDQFDTVHVDESWFYLNRVDNAVTIIDGVTVPDAPTTQHKSHIPKVMFLVAMARPRTLPDGTFFDGKIGMWECTEQVAATRNSVNRPAGTLETKPKSLTAEFYRELFTKEGGVIEKIKEKMPWMSDKILKIQHDGARPHTGQGNEQLISAHANTGTWRIRFVTQPAQSPDLNILDLGLFHSLKIKVNQLKVHAHNIDTLIAKVRQAFNAYDANTLDHIWAHLFNCYDCILTENGGNQYKPPHGGSRRRHRNAPTAVNLNMNVDNYNRVFNMLNH
jgi:hypothetical protein